MLWSACNTLNFSAAFATDAEIENVSVGIASYPRRLFLQRAVFQGLENALRRRNNSPGAHNPCVQRPTKGTVWYLMFL